MKLELEPRTAALADRVFVCVLVIYVFFFQFQFQLFVGFFCVAV